MSTILLTGSIGADLTGTAGILHRLGICFGRGNAEGDSTKPVPMPGRSWERVDVTLLNRWIIRRSGCKGQDLFAFDLRKAHGTDLSEFHHRAIEIRARLSGKKPCFLKDLWFSLTLPFWLPVFESPTVVMVHSPPWAAAVDLEKQRGIPFKTGLALWEFMTCHCLKSCAHVTTISLAEEEVADDPAGTERRLRELLLEAGVRNLATDDERNTDGDVECSSAPPAPPADMKLTPALWSLYDFVRALPALSRKIDQVLEPGEAALAELRSERVLEKFGWRPLKIPTDVSGPRNREMEWVVSAYHRRLQSLIRTEEERSWYRGMVQAIAKETGALVKAPWFSLRRIRAAWRVLSRGGSKPDLRVLEKLKQGPPRKG